LVKGARVARSLVPALYELMVADGHGVKWDPIPYPRVGFEDPFEKLIRCGMRLPPKVRLRGPIGAVPRTRRTHP
jgi:hypothetical protein